MLLDGLRIKTLWASNLGRPKSLINNFLTLAAQAKMSKEYPSHYSSTALMSTMGAIQATAFGLCVERDWSQWKLGWNIRLLAVAYSVYILLLI
jgi:hypothetical protein